MKRTICVLLILCLLAAGLPAMLAESSDDALVVVQEAESDVPPADDALLLLDLASSQDGESGDDDGEEVVLDLSGDDSGGLPSEAEGGAQEGAPSGAEDNADASPDNEALKMLFEEQQEQGDGTEGAPSSLEPVELELTADIDSPLDSDDLFAAYVNRILYGQRTRSLRTRATSSAGDQLTGQTLNFYNALKEHILKVAAGEESSTEFSIPVATVLGGDTFTPAEYNELLANGWSGVNSWDTSLLSHALWFDCTYELYWLKRYPDYEGDSYSDISFSYYSNPLTLGDDGNYHIIEGCRYTATFAVSSRYAVKDTLYRVDTGLIAGARTAAENAKAIVKKYADYSDCGKLMGYARSICALVEYNDAAAAFELDDPTDQDPWKLIYVFDGDDATNVVCEGYSQAFQYLCELTGFNDDIRCCLVTGIAGGDHSWNLVRMEDGRNYVLDVTWMDKDYDLNGLTGSMADWFNDGKGRMFLCGGEGNVSDGYKVYYRTGGGSSSRTYRKDTLDAYPASMLTLASGKYVLSGWQKLGGSTYYFDDGHYVTGLQSIGGDYYEFDDHGRLVSSQVTGWRVIDGDHYYFNDSGVMVAGWQKIAGIEYYFGDDGAMRIGWQTIDGTRYFFTDDGALHTIHTEVVDAGTPATCIEEGLTAGSHCSVCGEVLKAQGVIPPFGHTVVVDDAVAPTCTESGLTWGIHCSVCDEVLKAQGVIPPFGHTVVVDDAVAPTCTETGLTEGSHCSVCGTVLTAQKVVDAKGHKLVVDPAVAPTGTKTGLTEGSHCANCGVVFVEQKVIPVLTPTSVKLNKSGTVTLIIGKKLKLQATVAPAGAKKELTWTSNRPTVATVTQKGTVKAVGKGTATITVRTSNGKKAKLKVKVVPPEPRRIKLSPSGKATLKKGRKLTLKVKFYPANAESKLIWTSSAPKIASVSKNGVVRARKKGNAKITVSTPKGKETSIEITVTK